MSDDPPRKRMVKPPTGGTESGRVVPARLKTAWKAPMRRSDSSIPTARKSAPDARRVCRAAAANAAIAVRARIASDNGAATPQRLAAWISCA